MSAWSEVQAWRDRETAAAFSAYKASLRTAEARDEATEATMPRTIQPQAEVLRRIPGDLLEGEKWVPYRSPESAKDYGYDPDRDLSEAPRPYTTIKQLARRHEWRDIVLTLGVRTQQRIRAFIDLPVEAYLKDIVIPQETFEVYETVASDAATRPRGFRGFIRLVTGKALNELRVEEWRKRAGDEAAEEAKRRAEEKVERERQEAEAARLAPYLAAKTALGFAQSAVEAVEGSIRALKAQLLTKEAALTQARSNYEATEREVERLVKELGVEGATVLGFKAKPT